jgi:hypothetical protein
VLNPRRLPADQHALRFPAHPDLQNKRAGSPFRRRPVSDPVGPNHNSSLFLSSNQTALRCQPLFCLFGYFDGYTRRCAPAQSRYRGPNLHEGAAGRVVLATLHARQWGIGSGSLPRTGG